MEMTITRPAKAYRVVRPKHDIRYYIELIEPKPRTEDGHRNSVEVNFKYCHGDGWTVPAMWAELDEKERAWVIALYPDLDPTKDVEFLPKRRK